MKLTLEHYDTKVCVEVAHDDVTIDSLIRDMVVPVLLGAGFHEDGVLESLRDYKR